MKMKKILNIKNKIFQGKQKDYLDLTNPNYKNDKKWQYIGLEVVTRPYKKFALAIAGSLALFSIILPADFGLGMLAGYKFLVRFG